jgi:hypothetical protein
VFRTLRQILPPAGWRFVAMQQEPMAPEDLEDLLTRAAGARRLARAIPDDPMGLRLAEAADELDAEIDRETKIITSGEDDNGGGKVLRLRRHGSPFAQVARGIAMLPRHNENGDEGDDNGQYGQDRS